MVETLLLAVETTDDAVDLTISDDGPGIPDVELEVLDQGEETPLAHGSGPGRWLVDWVVERSASTVTFDTGSNGTEVRLSVPRA